MNTPPEYEQLIRKHNLNLLQGGSDFQLSSAGGLAADRRGHIQVGTKYFNALRHFVESWRMNAPVIEELIFIIQSFLEKESELGKQLDQVVNESVAMMLQGETPTHNTFAASDQMGSFRVGRDACAGSVMIIINTLLEALKDDVDGGRLWNTTQPTFAGYSTGQVIKAGSNNFRHYDEWAVQWAKEKKFIHPQITSVEIIMKVLEEKEPQMIAKNVCGNLLLVLCECDHEKLENLVFSFANVLVERANSNFH